MPPSSPSSTLHRRTTHKDVAVISDSRFSHTDLLLTPSHVRQSASLSSSHSHKSTGLSCNGFSFTSYRKLSLTTLHYCPLTQGKHTKDIGKSTRTSSLAFYLRITYLHDRNSGEKNQKSVGFILCTLEIRLCVITPEQLYKTRQLWGHPIPPLSLLYFSNPQPPSL